MCWRGARRLGRRTFIGGPWASSEPELLLKKADHVMVGEAEEAFADIAKALEEGTARALYEDCGQAGYVDRAGAAF